MTQIHEQLLNIVTLSFVIQTLLAAVIAASINFLVGVAVTMYKHNNTLRFDHKAINQKFTILREEYDNYPDGYDLIEFEVYLKLLRNNITNLPMENVEGIRSKYLLKSKISNAPKLYDKVYKGSILQTIKEISYVGTFAAYEIYEILVESERI